MKTDDPKFECAEVVAPAGNMAGVLRAWSDSVALSERRREKQGAFHAEIVPGCSPKWHLLITAPNSEFTAAAHLVARRFGVYVPTSGQEIKAARGRKKRIRLRPLFASYVPIFVWDIERHWRRIHSCPGVTGVLLSGDRPAVIPDDMIDFIQGCELREHKYLFKQLLGGGRQRGRRREPGEAVLTATISTYSALHGVMKLEPEQASGVLRKALGVA